jgi:NitT/TauT family transport system substrate-binding protein
VTGEDGGSGGDASGTVRVGHLPSALFAPLYVADAMGYFEQEGITLELTPLKSGQDGIPMLSNDQLDVMVAGFSAGMFNALEQGLAFKVVGSMGISPGDPENSPTALEVRQELLDDGTVTSVADLRGRTIGVAGGPGATGGYLLAAMLEEGGLTLNDVEISNLATPDQEPAITNGSVDAATPSAPFSSAMEEAGVASPIAVPAQGTTGTGVIYSETLGQDIEVLKASPMYTYLPDLAPQPEQLEAMQSVWIEAEQITYTEPLDIAGIVDASFAEGAGA